MPGVAKSNMAMASMEEEGWRNRRGAEGLGGVTQMVSSALLVVMERQG